MQDAGAGCRMQEQDAGAGWRSRSRMQEQDEGQAGAGCRMQEQDAGCRMQEQDAGCRSSSIVGIHPSHLIGTTRVLWATHVFTHIVELHMSSPTLLQSIAEYDFSKIHGRSKGMAGARAARALQVVVSMAFAVFSI
jgi:hypothetical protein